MQNHEKTGIRIVWNAEKGEKEVQESCGIVLHEVNLCETWLNLVNTVCSTI